MNIMPNNLGRQYSLNASEYEEKALEVLRSGWYILGNRFLHLSRNGPGISAASTVWGWPAVLMRCG